MVLVVKNPPANAGDVRDAGSIPGSGRAPEDRQEPGESNPTDRGAWWAAVHRVTQSRTRLKRLSMHAEALQQRGKKGVSRWRNQTNQFLLVYVMSEAWIP